MASAFRRLRRKKTTTNIEDQRTKSVAEDRRMVEAGVESLPQRVESERDATVSDERSELTSWEHHLLDGVSRGYKIIQNTKLQHISKFIVFVIVCWLVGISARNYFSPHSEVYWFLKELDLLDYYSEFRDYGFENKEEIAWATDQDLLDAGVKLRAHRIRILARTQKLKNHFPLLLCLLCILLICQSLFLSAFMLCLVFHDGFRQKISALLLWSSITLWGRFRKYQRYLKEHEDLGTLHVNEMRDSTITSF